MWTREELRKEKNLSNPKVILPSSGLSANYRNCTALMATSRATAGSHEWVTHGLNVTTGPRYMFNV